MGFGQGLSGLNAAAQNLDVIGNNIANSGTVGFKTGSATFADVYANSRVGLGVQVTGVKQRFTVGNVSGTGNMFDMAIDGEKGFFRLTDSSGAVYYSRNGQFFADKNGDIVNAQGQHLTGYPPGGIGMDPVPMKVPFGNIAPVATSGATTQANLDANATVINPLPPVPAVNGQIILDDGTNPPVTHQFTTDASGAITWVGTAPSAGSYNGGTITISASNNVSDINGDASYVAYQPAIPGAPFDPKDPATFTKREQISVYDSLGNAHQLAQYFVKIAGTGTSSQWQVHYRLDGQPMDVPAGGGPLVLNFDTGGRMTTPPNQTLVFNSPGGTSSPADPLNITLNYTGTTSFGGKPSFTPTQNGYATGEYAGMSIAKDGSLMANYTNGQTQSVGVLALANFNNVQGLQPAGGNAWIETSESGQALLGQPGTNGLATIKGQSIEESNVDMSQELVNMIIAQRTYQANAQTIKTQDQVLQTLITMR